ncbi:MAG TPA: PAS domain-containing protein [Anaerolineae bacterium]|nr:PAS domain-containing protein [Anaerolineae bacterium]
MKSKKRPNNEQLQRLQTRVYDAAPDSIFFFSAEDLNILSANHSAIKALGYTKEELLRMSILDLYPQEEHRYVHEALSRLHKTGSFQGERIVHHKRKDGTLIPVQPNGALLKVDDQEFVLCFCLILTFTV